MDGKLELQDDALSVEGSDHFCVQENKPLTEWKLESVDSANDLTSEVKTEEDSVGLLISCPAQNFKSEVEFSSAHTQKEELSLKEMTEENKVCAESFLDFAEMSEAGYGESSFNNCISVEGEDIDDEENGSSEKEMIVETEPMRSRKRTRCPEQWKRTKEKKARYKPKAFPKTPICKHPDGKLRCNELSMQDVRRIHQKFQKQPDRVWQNNFILQHISVSSVRRTFNVDNPRRKISTQFVLPKRRDNVVENIRVCRAAFVSILHVGRDRLHRLCQKYFENETTATETRGGDRRTHKYKEKKEGVMQHVKKFKPLQSHYSRGKNCNRQYLRSELNVKKMWSMYIEENPEELHVDYDYYRTIFNDNFNIGFGSPYVDKCSTCSSLENRITAEKRQTEREALRIQLKVHKTRSDVFYKQLQEQTDGQLTLSYDCQKNLILPKVPDQAAYYSRQLYLYNFTICQGHSGCSQTKENTFAYVWTENEYAKGSNQIASAVHHRLSHTNMDCFTSVRIFSDGCGGQNKNTTMLGMVIHWFLSEAPENIKKIEIWFPIVGHSFIPPDRVFGNLERQFQSLSVIENSSGYIGIIEKFATIISLGKDCPVHDWKGYADQVMKKPGNWHFQFQKSKKLIITKSVSKRTCLVQGEPFYNFESGEPKSLNKKGKHFQKGYIPNSIPMGVILKEAKIRDIKSLLELHFGEDWVLNANLSFYTEMFNQQQGLGVADLNENEGEHTDVVDFELMDEEEPDIL
ncbi:uncharacterized protein [Periplaneta americana]|uniref:uncharacterized protein n=1 Tax=Periplaneta americana TaxID=6978 RepID=UPI0037E76A55